MHRLIVGRSNSGKSALAKRLGSELRMRGNEVIAFNPIIERGYSRIDEFGCAAAEWETSDPDEFEREVKRRFNEDKTKRRFLIIDEAHEFFTRAGCQNLWLGTRGRHYGFNIIAITQRGAMIHPTFRSQCGSLYLFQCSLTDAKFLSDEYGRAELQKAVNMLRGQFIKIERDTLTYSRVF